MNTISQKMQLKSYKNTRYIINLEWCNHSDNMKHAWDTGLMVYGSSSPISILNEETNKHGQRLTNSVEQNVDPFLILRRLKALVQKTSTTFKIR